MIAQISPAASTRKPSTASIGLPQACQKYHQVSGKFDAGA
jgi:hypothetical protein